MNRQKNLLQIPTGTESFLLEEAYIHRKCARSIGELLESWGYLPAQIPVFDFFDLYRPLLDEKTAGTIYRLIDREGDLLMLRSDITLFLAKQTGLAITSEDLPVRIWYADTILRHQHREDISKNEFFQVGAELIGKKGLNGDLEILFLLIQTLDLLNLPSWYIHLGSRSLFNAFYPDLGGENRETLMTKIVNREPLDPPEDLFRFIGDLSEFHNFIKGKNYSPEIKRELNHLYDIGRHLQEILPPEKLRIDLSEIGSQPYYTGVIFQVYMEGMDSSIASGGRYDELLAHFGFNAPSVGFSLLLRKVEPFIGNIERFQPPDKVVHISGSDFMKTYKKAQIERDRGKTVTL